MLLTTVGMLYLSLDASIKHFKHAVNKGYAIYKVEDTVHFLMVIEIVTIASSFFVTMIVLFFASITNQRQKKPQGQGAKQDDEENNL